MNAIIPIFLLILSGGVFFGYIDGTYTQIKDLQGQLSSYNDSLDSAKTATGDFAKLQQEYNQIPQQDIDQIKRFLPDNIDNIRLIIDINNIALRHGMAIREVNVDGKSVGASSGVKDVSKAAATPSVDKVGEVGVTFSVTGTYENFLAFIKDMERSMRLVDINHISVSASTAGKATSDYGVSVKTYWLK